MLANTKFQKSLLGALPWRLGLLAGAVLLLIQIWLVKTADSAGVAWWLWPSAQFLLIIALVWLGLQQVANRRRLLAIFNNSPIVLYSIDAEARIVNINKVGARKLGYARSELIGKTLRDFMPAKERAALNAMANDQPLVPTLMETGSVSNLKVVLKGANGKPVFGSVSARLTRTPRGRITGADCVIFDETDWVVAEESLKHARAELFRTFSDLPVPLFHCAQNGFYRRANTSLLKLMECATLDQLNELNHGPVLTTEILRRSDSSTLECWGPVTLSNRRQRPVAAQLLLRSAQDSSGEAYLEGVLVEGRAMARHQTAANEDNWADPRNDAA